MKKKEAFDITLLCLGVVLVILGVVLIPQITNLGLNYINLITAVLLVVFISIFIIPMIKLDALKEKTKIFTIVNSIECCVLAILFVGLIIFQFVKDLKFDTSAMKIVGIVLILHSALSIIKKYFTERKEQTTFYFLLLNLVILLVGSFFLFSNLVTNNIFVTIIAICLICVGCCLTLIHIIKLVQGYKIKPTSTNTNKEENKQEIQQQVNVEK